MLVALAGMVTEVSEVQFSKAKLPMLVTLAGMVTEVRVVSFTPVITQEVASMV
jgi:hypothetical protein